MPNNPIYTGDWLNIKNALQRRAEFKSFRPDHFVSPKKNWGSYLPIFSSFNPKFYIDESFRYFLNIFN